MSKHEDHASAGKAQSWWSGALRIVRLRLVTIGGRATSICPKCAKCHDVEDEVPAQAPKLVSKTDIAERKAGRRLERVTETDIPEGSACRLVEAGIHSTKGPATRLRQVRVLAEGQNVDAGGARTVRGQM